jgi:glycosyltransferase involved in cell wall biosynthesis
MPATSASSFPAVSANCKFFSRNAQKFFFKGMRIGRTPAVLDFAEKLRLRKQLDDRKAGYTTGLILDEVQAHQILDLATQAGLPSLVEIRIDPADLRDPDRWRGVVSRAAHLANVFRGRPALFGYLVDCPLSQDELRAAGLERVRRRLRYLLKTIKRHDDRVMAALRHRAATRALALLDEDFIYADVPALSPADLKDYIVSLHNLAEARPVILEFAETSPGQDQAVALAFGTGAAGVVAPLVPAAVPASRDWLGAKLLRASDVMPFVALNGACPPGPAETPMVSVIICAYNAERTMRACLESLRHIAYPNYEVVIVDDGSRDRTAEIAAEFPEFRLIRQPNKGLAVARNVGLHAARGALIAYTDSDCVVDPHWVSMMVRTMQEGRFDGCGGPNYAPHEAGRTQGCVAASPGAPSHVLVADDRAEHLAGCNMMFTKLALEKVGAFDPRFRTAGDDVDICWRLLDAGFRLGYSPAAFVWHFRRNTIKAYYGQQKGYGRAEAMLFELYPERFNGLGQIKWRGTIPGLARTIPGGARRRVWWSAKHPAITAATFDAPLNVAKCLPLTGEWTLVWAMVAVVLGAFGFSVLPALAMLTLGPIWALYYAWHAPLEKCHDSLRSRLLIAFLAFTGPMARSIERYKTRVKLARDPAFDAPARQRPAFNILRRALRLAYWNEAHVTRESLLDRLLKAASRAGYPALSDQGWNDYDIEIHPNPWVKVQIKTADEEHEGARLKNHVDARVRLSMLSKMALVTGTMATVGCAAMRLPLPAAATTAATVVGAAYVLMQAMAAARWAYRAVEQGAAELELVPLGQAMRHWRRVTVAVTPAAPAAREFAARQSAVEPGAGAQS